MGRFLHHAVAGIRLALLISGSLGGVVSFAGPARAQSLAIAPVTLNIAPGQRATSLTITNAGSVESVVQIRPFLWTQHPDDALTPATDVVISPPIVKIPANGSQIVRILVRRPAEAREVSYRLLVDQIPPPATPGTVQLALRFSLPVFVEPVTAAKAKIQARIVDDAGKAVLVLENIGSRHEKLRQIALQGDNGRPIAIEGGEQLYVLPGATRSLALAGAPSLSNSAKPYRLTAQSKGGPLDMLVAKSEAR